MEFKNKLTIIESPYAGNIKFNIEYAKLCVKNSIERNETPFASHLFYTQVLDDTKIEERNLGISLGLNIMHLATNVAIYIDLGISKGMREGMRHAQSLDIPIDFRKLFSK